MQLEHTLLHLSEEVAAGVDQWRVLAQGVHYCQAVPVQLGGLPAYQGSPLIDGLLGEGYVYSGDSVIEVGAYVVEDFDGRLEK